MIYLASPYTHRYKKTQQKRYEQALEVAAALTRSGLTVYSPIVHFHPMAVRHDLPTDFAFWRGVNLDMLGRSQKLVVLKLDGWQESAGVQAEIEFATRYLPRSVEYLEPVEWLK